MLLICGTAFAMAKKPAPDTYEYCINTVYEKCSTNANHFGPFDAAWYKCASKIYPVCRCVYRPDLVVRAGDNCNVVLGVQ